jgi:hypothetical protein
LICGEREFDVVKGLWVTAGRSDSKVEKELAAGGLADSQRAGYSPCLAVDRGSWPGRLNDQQIVVHDVGG